jgi:hypothetical protein
MLRAMILNRSARRQRLSPILGFAEGHDEFFVRKFGLDKALAYRL